MSVCCECRMLLGRSLCDELITRPEESYRLWCVVVCDLETSRMRRSWLTGGEGVAPKTNIQLLLVESHIEYRRIIIWDSFIIPTSVLRGIQVFREVMPH